MSFFYSDGCFNLDKIFLEVENLLRLIAEFFDFLLFDDLAFPQLFNPLIHNCKCCH